MTDRARPTATFSCRLACILALAGVVAGASLLASCSTYRAAKQDISSDTKTASNYVDKAEHAQGPTGPGNVRVENGVWLGDAAVKSAHGMPLPARFESPKGISLSSGDKGALTLAEIAAYITHASGIEIVGATEIGRDLASGAQADQSAGDAAAGAKGQPPLVQLPGSSGNGARNAANAQTPRVDAMPIAYVGPVSGLLDLVAAHFGISWKYESGVIRLFDVETRTFTVFAPPTQTKVDTQIDSAISGEQQVAGSSGSSTSSNNSTQSTEGVHSTITLDHWKSIKTTIESLLPKHGASFALSPDSGSVTVTASPAVLERVGAFIRDENERMSRQVQITVKLYSVQLSSSDASSLDLTKLILQGVGGRFANATVTNVSSSNLGLPLGTPQAVISLNGTPAGNAANTSQIAVNALSSVGNVTLLTESTVTATNNQPTPVNVGTQTAYVQSVTQSQTANVGSQTSIVPGMVSTGFSMDVLPRILASGDIFLQYDIGLSSLAHLTSFSSGGATVQLPEINTRGFQQSVKIHTGATLVLAGYQSLENTVDESGTGFAQNWLFGGGENAQKSRTIIVILLTPTLLEDTSSIAVAR